MNKPTYDELFEQCSHFEEQIKTFKETEKELKESKLQLTRLLIIFRVWLPLFA